MSTPAHYHAAARDVAVGSKSGNFGYCRRSGSTMLSYEAKLIRMAETARAYRPTPRPVPAPPAPPAVAPSRDERIAVHEAGHAVACLAAGIRVDEVSIVPGPLVPSGLWANGRCVHVSPLRSKQDHLDQLAVALAGSLAVEQVHGRADRSGHDERRVADLLAALHTDPADRRRTQARMTARAREILRQPAHRRALGAIAEALLLARMLPGDAVERLYRVAHGSLSAPGGMMRARAGRLF